MDEKVSTAYTKVSEAMKHGVLGSTLKAAVDHAKEQYEQAEKAAADPSHPEHETAKEAVGGGRLAVLLYYMHQLSPMLGMKASTHELAALLMMVKLNLGGVQDWLSIEDIKATPES